jgi:hypothetical protein
MDAHIRKTVCTTASGRVALLAALLLGSMGASRQTANFIVETADPNFAQQVADAAETYRRDLAIAWMGKAMPDWWQPCVMSVQDGPNLGAGGATTFKFQGGEVFEWRMSIQGSRERILDSVLPHEITHMIFACHFRQPLPRWADEGGATSVEHSAERNKHRQMLPMFLRTGRGIAFNQMFAMMEYPRDYMPLYAQGYSLAEFLIQAKGRRAYIEFLDDGMKNDDWSAAVQRHYQAKDLGVLQDTWLTWVKQGAPLSKPGESMPTQLLAANGRRPRPEPNLIYRIRDKQPRPTDPDNLTPIRGTASGEAASSAIASNVPRSEPRTLPVSGWHAPGQRETVVMAGATTPLGDSSPTQVSRPQPPQSAGQTILR